MPLLVFLCCTRFWWKLSWLHGEWGQPVLISPAKSTVILDSTRMIGEKFPEIVGVCAHYLDLDMIHWYSQDTECRYHRRSHHKHKPHESHQSVQVVDLAFSERREKTAAFLVCSLLFDPVMLKVCSIRCEVLVSVSTSAPCQMNFL